MKRTILILLIIVCIGYPAYSQKWLWGRQGTTISDNINNIAADTKGNAYLCGYFNDSISFGSSHLSSTGTDLFLAKYDSLGNIKWIIQSNGGRIYAWYGCMVSTDDSDNIYVAGNFKDSIHFGTITLTTKGTSVFLVKYDKNGNLVWGEQSKNGTGGGSYLTNIKADDSSNVYITGYYQGNVSFDSINFSDLAGTAQLFVVKYNSIGKLNWSLFSIGIAASYARGWSLSCNGNGDIYVIGDFRDSISIGSTYFKSKYGDIFILKYNNKGNLDWAQQSKSSAGQIYPWASTNDLYRSFYLTGIFRDTVIIGFDTLIGSGFLLKFDSIGKIIWAKNSPPGYSLASDIRGNIYFASAASKNKTVFDKDTFSGDSLYTDPSLFLKLDTASNVLQSSIIGTGGDDNNAIVCSPDGRFVYVGGDIADTITFGNDFLVNTDVEPPFIARWNMSNSLDGVAKAQTTNNNILIFPNPSNGTFNLFFGQWTSPFDKYKIEVFDLYGKRVLYQNLKSNLTQMDLKFCLPGIYYYRILKNFNIVSEGKLSIMK